MTLPNAQWIALAILAVNVAAFLAFWADKQLARNGAWRVSERTLLWLALVGGSPGAIAAQQAFRHKTRKEPFRSQLLAIVTLQAVFALVLLALRLGPQAWTDWLLDLTLGAR